MKKLIMIIVSLTYYLSFSILKKKIENSEILYVNYIHVVSKSSLNYISSYLYSKLEITNNYVNFYDGQTSGASLPHYQINLQKLKPVEETLLPDIKTYQDFYIETKIKGHWFYNEYFKEINEFVDEYSKTYQNADDCRILNEYTLNFYNNTQGVKNLFIICFLSKMDLNTFTKTIINNYIKIIENIKLKDLNDLEIGKAIGVFYSRPDYPSPKLTYLRLLENTIIFYSDNNCIEEAYPYSYIQDCSINYEINMDYNLVVDNKCCINFKRLISMGITIKENICSFRQSLQICILEIRQVQKELINNCMKNMLDSNNKDIDTSEFSFKDAEKELKNDDKKIEKILGEGVEIEETIKCCICDDKSNNNKNNTSLFF